MKSMPSYEFRNYLFKIGIINYSDFPKIHEDADHPKNQIISLSHLLENAQGTDLFGKSYLDIADRIFQGWLNFQQENVLKRLFFIKSLILHRQKSRSFHLWHFSKDEKQTKNIKKPADFAPAYSNPTEFKHSPKLSQHSYGSSTDLKNLLAQSSSPMARSMHYSMSNSFTEKNDQSALFDRLYQDAAKKKLLLEKAQNEEKTKTLEECTFRPEISDYSQKKAPVYDRANCFDLKEKEEFYKKQKSVKELEGCTFHPQTLSTHSVSIDNSFDKLYRDAEVQRQKMRSLELIEKNKEIADCTFRPAVLNPSQNTSGSVYEKLYKSYQDSQKEKRKLELERKAKEEEGLMFVPKLLTPKRETESIPVYARLYAEVERRRLKKLNEEKERSSSASRARKNDEPPRYEQLYAMHKESKEKKAVLQERIWKENGVSFKPDMSKNGTASRSKTPKSEVSRVESEYSLKKK